MPLRDRVGLAERESRRDLGVRAVVWLRLSRLTCGVSAGTGAALTALEVKTSYIGVASASLRLSGFMPTMSSIERTTESRS